MRKATMERILGKGDVGRVIKDMERQEKETLKQIKSFEKFLKKSYGNKCKDYCKGCTQCDVWKSWETLKKVLKR